MGYYVDDTEQRLLFLEKVVAILIAEKYGVELDSEDEDMIDELFQEKYYK